MSPGGKTRAKASSSTGCLFCRARKVGCDEQQPCGQCRQIGLACPGSPRESRDMSRKDLLELLDEAYRQSNRRRRSVGSCQACRKTKSRCTRALPSCHGCNRRGTECVYGAGKGAAGSPPTSPPTPLAARMPRRRDSTTTENPTNRAPTAREKSSCPSPFSVPREVQLQILQAYFNRIHPLRCNALLHKPAFMHSFDHDRLAEDYEECLIYAVYALGAWLVLRDEPNDPPTGPLSTPSTALSTIAAEADKMWAEAAQTRIFSGFRAATIQQLITLVLLCEYAYRTEHFSSAFTLAGCLCRQVRVLGLDVPADNEPASSLVLFDREVEHRVVWASYCVDVLLGSGVDKNSSWRTDFPRIPLPCANAQFLSTAPSRPYLMISGDDPRYNSVIRELDLPALNVMLIYLRTRVLSYIRKPVAEISHESAMAGFMSLLQELEQFRIALSGRLALNDLNLYVLRDNRELGSVVCLHVLYHAAVCDLTRITLPGFDFPLAAALRHASADFVFQCAQRCCFHAEEISGIIRTTTSAGPSAFDDPIIADATLESTKIQIVYSAAVSNHANNEKTTRNIQTNLELLESMRLNRTKPSPHVQVLLPICTAFGFRDIAIRWEGKSTDRLPELKGPSNLHHLPRTSLFRRARDEAGAAREWGGNIYVMDGYRSNGVQAEVTRRQPPPILPDPLVRPNELTSPQITPSRTMLPQRHSNLGGMIPTITPSLVHPGWSALSTNTEDYVQVAEDMSFYLTQTGLDPSWWDLGA